MGFYAGNQEIGVWTPPQIALGFGATSGVSIYGATGGGLLYSFDGSSDDSWSLNQELYNQGQDYDGSDLQIKLKYIINTTPNTSDDVHWDVTYQIAGVGDDPNGVGTSFTHSIDLTGKSIDTVYEETLSTNLTGTEGDKDLMITLTRNAQGAGADAYAGSIRLIGLKLTKV